MWTPRRVLLMVLGLGLFVVAYVFYDRSLGWLDGLPPLPEEYLIIRPPGAPIPSGATAQVLPINRKLEQAFGTDCLETDYAIKLDVQAQGLALAFDYYKILDDGRVMLTPFSVATFGKDTDPKQFPEINTVHSDVAYLEFERPIKQMGDMGKSRIVAAELVSLPDLASNDPRKGYIHVFNNRRTQNPDDDLYLRTPGPLYYREAPRGVASSGQPQLWTKSAVWIEDRQSRPAATPAPTDGRPAPPPQMTTISATGMNVFLKGDQPTPKPPTAGKPTQPEARPGGVERVELCSVVHMNLWMDSNGFLGASPPKPPAGPPTALPPGATPAPPPKSAAPEKVRVEIKTLGPFRYDVERDRARFDIAPPINPNLHNYVEVRRFVRAGVNDQLLCDALELQFRRKPPPSEIDPATKRPLPTPPPPAAGATAGPMGGPGAEREIEWAHAWGKTVALSSDTEDLSALGDDLMYAATRRETVLKGRPMIAMKDGNEIRAPDLTISDAKPGEPQEAYASGPGELRMLDRGTGKQSLHARWRDRLTFGKDRPTKGKEREPPADLLTLDGQAAFEDAEHHQELEADQIKVWLAAAKVGPPSAPSAPPAQPATAPKPAAGKPAAPPGDSRKPERLQASGKVRVRAPDLSIHDTDYFTTYFQDVPEPPAVPAAVPAPATVPPPAPAPATGPAPAAPVVVAVTPPEAPSKPNRPLDLSAHSVEAHIKRTGTVNELDYLVCEGRVKVHQDPEPAPPEKKPADKTKPGKPGATAAVSTDQGVDIVAERLRLTRYPEGHILDLAAAPRSEAEFRTDKLSLWGPIIHIDQKANTATVTGAGRMRMPVSSDLEGKPRAKPVDLDIRWKKEMIFSGNYAYYQKDVEAEQADAKLTCQNMQVFFDRLIYLNPANKPIPKPGTPPEPEAKVAKVVCDSEGLAKPVRVVESLRPPGEPPSFKRIDSSELILDNAESTVSAPGPGKVWLWQMGSKDEAAGPQAPPANAKPAAVGKSAAAEKEMKLTIVEYQGKMFANQKTRTVTFRDKVEVVHAPSEIADRVIDVNKLPPGGVYLRGEVVIVVTIRGVGTNRDTQELTATDRASVEAREFYGSADKIKYSEDKDLVIFEGDVANPAVLNRRKGRGDKPDEIKGAKILYWRKTNSFEVEKALSSDIAN